MLLISLMLVVFLSERDISKSIIGGTMDSLDERLMNIEMALANQERVVEDLNQVVIEQGKVIDLLQKQNQYLLSRLDEETVKPLNEETPPPHY